MKSQSGQEMEHKRPILPEKGCSNCDGCKLYTLTKRDNSKGCKYFRLKKPKKGCGNYFRYMDSDWKCGFKYQSGVIRFCPSCQSKEKNKKLS